MIFVTYCFNIWEYHVSTVDCAMKCRSFRKALPGCSKWVSVTFLASKKRHKKNMSYANEYSRRRKSERLDFGVFQNRSVVESFGFRTLSKNRTLLS